LGETPAMKNMFERLPGVLECWSFPDFGFWNLDCGLKLQKVDAQLLGRTLNPKSEI
jgi:hypothetical protein